MKKILLLIVPILLLILITESISHWAVLEIISNLLYPDNYIGVIKALFYIFIYILINITVIMQFLYKKLNYIVLVFIFITMLVDLSYYKNGIVMGFNTEQFILAYRESSHIFDAIFTFYKSIFFIIILVIIFMILMILYFRKNIVYRSNKVPFILLVISLLLGYYIQNKSVLVYNLPAIIKVPISIAIAKKRGLLDIKYRDRQEVVSVPSFKDQYKNIIFIIDESIRGDFLSINGYKKNTTPYLKSLNNLMTLGVASSAGNASAISHYIIRNGISINELPDRKYRTLVKPNIFQYAKKAGYTTVLVDSQVYNNELQNYMSLYDLKNVDIFITHKKRLPLSLLDRDMTDKVANLLNNSNQKHFVYFIKEGAHFPYQIQYPKNKEFFKPVLKKNEALDFNKRKEAINTYQNAIKWAVDDFFKYLLKELNTNNTLVFYTADHGQNILENNILVTHGLAKNPTLSMAKVPIILFDTSGKIQTKFKKIYYNRYSHYQIFPSLLSIFGFSNNVYSKYGIPLWDGVLKKRYFFSGNIFNNGYINLYKKKNDEN